MGVLKWIGILLVPIAIAVSLSCFWCCSPRVKPDTVSGWWGYRDEKDSEPPSTAVEPFKVKVSDDVLSDLKTRLTNARLTDSLPGSNFEYGFNGEYLKKVIEHWKNKFDWKTQEKLLNSFPQFTTVIEGISVHFVHVKPSKNADKARPLLMVHGWPGSFFEFYKIIPMLVGTELSEVNFELVIPSIPGYGFSEAPHRMGFNAGEAARIFHKLMKRLGHDKYYVQGGDWGALITRVMAKMYDGNVIGLHLNWAVPPLKSCGVFIRQLIGVVFPSLIYTPEEIALLPSLSDQFKTIMRETGYMHIQATRPDTVATGLNDSPVGLAAYIIEKFSVWSNQENRFCADGCLTKHFTLDEVLTNVMIYWTTQSITSSVRFYRENLVNGADIINQIERLPLKVPTALSAFPHEIVPHAEALVKVYLQSLVQYTVMPRGGHFAAMEEPRLLADDIISFVKLVDSGSKQ